MAMKTKNIYKRMIFSSVIAVVGIIALIVGISYALFTSNNEGNNHVINAGVLSLILEEPASLSFDNLQGMTDIEGMEQDTYYEFDITNDGDANASYKVYLLDDADKIAEYEGNILSDEYLRFSVEVNGIKKEAQGLKELNRLLNEKTILKGEKDNYKLRIWLDLEGLTTEEIANLEGSTAFYKIAVQAEQDLDYEGNAPVLLDNMIPVYYDEGSGSWKKADQENITNKWYDYSNKMWANAVTVSETNREAYLSAEVGTEIAMSDINTMWVWIPRYKYTIFNANMSGSEITNEQEIKIEFEIGTTSTGTVTCVDSINNEDGTSEVCTDSTYGEVTNGKSTYTHPAFTFGDDELIGFWFGKFENSIDENNNIIIKPDALSWNNHNVSTAFEYSRKMELENNIYGFSSTATAYSATGELAGDTNNFDTHNIKNMEWGAVAYLIQSEYGRCTDGLCTEIYINNSARLDRQTAEDGSNIDTWYDTYTGRSGGTVGGGVSYKAYGTYSYDDYLISSNNSKTVKSSGSGVGAATTGNIYGIYDMSGGLWERIMDNMVDADGGFYAAGSGTWSTDLYPTLKYYDRYTYGSTYNDAAAYKRGKLGDATKEILKTVKETGGWYSGYSWFPNSGNPWFDRGGHPSRGFNAGVFNFGRAWGSTDSYHGSRVALIVEL